MLEDRRKQLAELNTKLESENVKLEELLQVKEAAEAPEKEAKDKYDQMLKEMKDKHENEKMMTKSAEAFQDIDTDSNQVL